MSHPNIQPGMREAIAKIISPGAWAGCDNLSPMQPERREISLEKADAILAITRPAPAEGREAVAVDPAMTPKEFVDSILSACDPSNWDSVRNKGAYYRGLHDAYTSIHEIAGEYQRAMYEWTRSRSPVDAREAVAKECERAAENLSPSGDYWVSQLLTRVVAALRSPPVAPDPGWLKPALDRASQRANEMPDWMTRSSPVDARCGDHLEQRLRDGPASTRDLAAWRSLADEAAEEIAGLREANHHYRDAAAYSQSVVHATTLLVELRRHEREYNSLAHGPLCGQAADEIERLSRFGVLTSDASKLMAVIDAALDRYTDVEKHGGLTDMGRHAYGTTKLLKQEMEAALAVPSANRGGGE